MSQVEAGVISTKPSKLMLKEVFSAMRFDEIGNVARFSDCCLGRKLAAKVHR